MPTEVICTLLTAASAALVAVIGGAFQKDKRKTEERAALRAEENLLSMKLMSATCAVSLVTAKAVFNQKTNGDVEEAMDAAKEAQEDYFAFIDGVAAKKIAK